MSEVIELTKLLRENKDYPFWEILRALLNDKGIDVAKAYLAFSSEEGNNSEFGIIVTSTKNIFQYAILLTEDGNDLKELAEWNDITNSYESSPYIEDINKVFAMIDQE